MRVAVFSGAIPSTTFIENLIVGLSGNGIEVTLFGVKRADTHYAENVSVHYFHKGRLKSALVFAADVVRLSFMNPRRMLRYMKYVSSNGNRHSLEDVFKHLRVLNLSLIHI